MALSAAMVLSGLPSEQFTEELQCVFSCGEILLKTPSSSSLGSTESCQSVESGISSMSAESLLESLDRYLEIISSMEEKFQNFQSVENVQRQSERIKIIYQDRDILDLDGHLKSEWLFQYARLQHNIASFLENRSLFSRISGAAIPRHFWLRCKDSDCGFSEPKYY